MVSFQGKLAAGLKARNIGVRYELRDSPYDAVLVIGGTRQLHRLWRVKRSGIPIVQRLDGMNWIHRVHGTGIRHSRRLCLRFLCSAKERRTPGATLLEILRGCWCRTTRDSTSHFHLGRIRKTPDLRPKEDDCQCR